MSTQPTTIKSKRRRTRLFAVVGAVVLVEILLALAGFGLGIRLQAPANYGSPPMELGPVFVGITAAVLSLVAWGLIALMERLTSRASNVWLAVAPLALLVSLTMPLGGTGVSSANRVMLVFMHLGVAAVLIPAFYHTSPKRETGYSQPGRPFAKGAQL